MFFRFSRDKPLEMLSEERVRAAVRGASEKGMMIEGLACGDSRVFCCCPFFLTNLISVKEHIRR